MPSPISPTAPRRPLVVFVVTSDPRETHRPAEAIRVAAGLGAWKKADVRVYLRGAAIRGLGEWVDDLKMEDDFTRYLPIIRDWVIPCGCRRALPRSLTLVKPPHRSRNWTMRNWRSGARVRRRCCVFEF